MKKNISRIEWPPIIARIVNYEYWPWYLFFLPLLPVWLYYAIRSQNLTYFTAVNPAIPLGGVFGESKSEILASIGAEYKPQTWTVFQVDRNHILTKMAALKVNFPIIIKPDVGERGYNVAKITDEEALNQYLAAVEGVLIVQEYIDWPLELGVLYHRLPGNDRGCVTSVTIKKFLSVTGNGKDSVRTLMAKRARTRIQRKRIEKEGKVDLDCIPEEGKELILEVIGNHCLGTTFLNGSHFINDAMHSQFDRITANYNGFHYGRFDLKVRDEDALRCGEDFRIFEVNGVTSEPGHIYDPFFSLWQAYRDTARHMGIVYHISRKNRLNGVRTASLTEVISSIIHHFKPKNKTPEKNPGVPSYISEQI